MDLNASSWLGDMSREFETMCVEVQSLGDSVKKFCSDTVDELLHLSPEDSLQQENPEWNLVYNFYMGNIHEKPVIRNQFKSHHSKSNVSESCNLSESPSSDATLAVLTETATEDGVATASALLPETDEGRETVENFARTSSIISAPDPVTCAESKKSDGESNADAKEKRQDRDESGGKPKSYKEKIQEIFQLRKRSSSKWSSGSLYQEQLKPCHQNKKSPDEESGKIKPSASSNSLLESGWEIL